VTNVEINRASNRRIVIVGSGIAGMGAAYLLNPHHDITLYEKNDYVGGHARTRRIRYGDKSIAVDTGFIVFNRKNYSNLTALFKCLGVPVQKSVMSFGVTSKNNELEWGAENLNALFGQRRNLLRPAFYKFLFDIVRFNNRAKRWLQIYPNTTLGELIEKMKLGEWFKCYYIVPMGGAIWSCPLSAILSFPAKFFITFFDAHGLLTVTQQPQWYTVTGGSAVYIDKLVSSFKDKIKISSGVTGVTRQNGRVQITDTHGNQTEYDQIVFASHADETLAMLDDATPGERSTLGAFRYQENMAVLHKHSHIMPRRHACWSSWIYHADTSPQERPLSVTYWMNHLQKIDKKYPLFVTLNPNQPIPDEDVFERHIFRHPVYDPLAVEAQSALQALQGQNNTWFCGAYQRNGFHEDGLASAVNVAAQMGVAPPWE
jgi:predicted NAD/FAD-binding protein